MFKRLENWRLATVLIIWLFVFSCFTTQLAACNDLKQRDDFAAVEETWQSLLVALEAGDIQQVRDLTTDNGFADLRITDDERSLLIHWQVWGTGMAELETRWQREDEHTIAVRVGSEKVHKFIFIRLDSGEWKLDEWLRGA